MVGSCVFVLGVFLAVVQGAAEGLPPVCSYRLIAKDVPQTIKSPGYPTGYLGNFNCTWNITTEIPDRHVVLEAVYSNLEPSANCSQGDNITVYDGIGPTRLFVESWCGKTKPNKIVSSGKSATVLFRSKKAKAFGGFSIKYSQTTASATCGGELVAGSSPSYFTSPGYPDKYSNNKVCTWTVRSQDRYSVLILETTDSELEQHINCLNDNVTVHDVYENNTLLEIFCGTSTPTMKSSGGFLRIVFRSNGQRVHRGFKMMYKQIPIRECDMNRTASNIPALIKSPGYPNGYFYGLNCTWIIETQNISSALHVEVDMEAEHPQQCGYNSLSFYEQGLKNRHIKTICRSTKTVIRARNNITIVFSTASSALKAGVVLKYYQSNSSVIIRPKPALPSASCGGLLYAGSEDSYVTGSMRGSGMNNYHCKWTMKASDKDKRVMLDVVSADFKSSGNCKVGNVTLYDESGKLLGQWCGDGFPSFKSSGQYLSVVFNSSKSANSRFTMRYRDSDGSSDSEESTSIALTVGGILGGFVLVAVIVVLGTCYWRRQKHAYKRAPQAPPKVENADLAGETEHDLPEKKVIA